jgi:outer membrane lipoprotein SlyB
MKTIYIALATAAVAVLPGCSSYSQPQYASDTYTPSTAYAPANYTAYGVVTSVRAVDQRVGTGTSGGGALLGGVAGGVLGHQVGSGRGNTAATIAGAAAGALIGNEIERNQGGATRRVYQVEVRFDDGSYQTLTQTDSFRVGERVLLRDGVLRHR